jgi:adenylylsulfate kinase-like enzyme
MVPFFKRATESQPRPGSTYEPPENPELVVHGDQETPPAAAQRVIEMLRNES